MSSRSWVVGAGLAVLLGASFPANAGGPGVGIVKIHGVVEVRSLKPGAKWRRARTGELTGDYMECQLRTGPGSWVHLRDFEAPNSPRSNVGCVEANSLLQIRSNCGYRIEVVRGKVSAVDGRPGKSLFRVTQK